MSKCSREKCGFPSKWTYKDEVFCGVHCSAKMRADGAVSTEEVKEPRVPVARAVPKLPGTMPAAPAAASSSKKAPAARSSNKAVPLASRTIKEIPIDKPPTQLQLEREAKELAEMRDLYAIVMARIESPEKLISLTREEVEEIVSLKTHNDDVFRNVMLQAVETAAGRNNIPRLASQIPVALGNYNEAVAEELIRVEPSYIPRNVNPRECLRAVSDKEVLLNEDGYYLICEDVDIEITNCNQVYIEAEGYKSIHEWAENPKHIYMGPRVALTARGPSGEYLWPSEQPTWYTPLPNKSTCRLLHNNQLKQDIIRRIENGEERAEKYLALKGKIIGCVCLPYPCHCQAIVEVVRELSKRTTNDDD